MINIVYICPLGLRQRQWRQAAAPPGTRVSLHRSSDLSREQLLALMSDADALITERSGAVDQALIAACPRLKIIHRYGSLDFDIDKDTARAAGIPVCVQPIRGTIAVAEQVVLQTLALLRRAMPLQPVLRQAPESFGLGAPQRTTEDVFAFNWSGQRGIRLLQDKRVGIWGFGEIGAELARRLSGWDASLLYTKRQRLPEPVEASLGVAYRSPEALLRESDVLISLMPYSTDTDLWLNAARIATMPAGALLVHAGSGSVIDEAAVTDALRRGHLSGASLDTFEWEPLAAENPLLMLANEDAGANVFLLPHTGSCNDGTANMTDGLYCNVMTVLAGGAPRWRVA
jgi:phosphoglycerate dehydrogenase-like enzyme